MFKEQIKKNAIALMSLVVAVVAVSLATWRNEVSEENRTIREAAFRVVKELGELELVAHYAHYEKDSAKGNPIKGWAHVLLIKDLTYFISPESQAEAKELHEVWQAYFDALGEKSESIEQIGNQIDATKRSVTAKLESLN